MAVKGKILTKRGHSTSLISLFIIIPNSGKSNYGRAPASIGKAPHHSEILSGYTYRIFWLIMVDNG